MRMHDLPDEKGHFGPYGGVFVAETLMAALEELREAYFHYSADPEFQAEIEYDHKHYVGRPSPMYHAKRWSEHFGGAQLYLKREDLNHTGAHKINNVLGQAMLARRMGKQRVIAETGAGMHGVATATIAARFGLECVVYMGSEDIKRQSANVARMQMLGAKVVPVESGSKTLKDALNGRRSTSLPYDGSRFPGHHRTRVPESDAGLSWSAARCDYRLCRRRVECNGYISRLPSG